MDSVSFERVAEMVRRMKVAVAQKEGWRSDPEAADLPPFIIASRAGHFVASLDPLPGPNGVREAAHAAAAFMRADEVWVLADARMRTEVPPDYVPEQGDIQRDWLAGRRQGITEAMLVYRFTRDGEGQVHIYPYRRRVRKVEWLEPADPDDGTKVEGAIPDSVAAGFAESGSKFAEVLGVVEQVGDDIGLDLEERDYHIDRAIAQWLTGQAVSSVSILDDRSLFDEEGEVRP
jgi:hypothetical protein